MAIKDIFKPSGLADMFSNMKNKDHRTYGIICAMANEIDLLKENLTVKDQRVISGMTYFRGEISGKKVVLVQCGIGKVSAAMCTQTLCTRFRVDALIFTGIGGSMHPEVHVFDIVISTQTVQHDFDLTAWGYAPGEVAGTDHVYFQASQQLIRYAHQAADAIDLNGARIFEGTIAGGDQFISKPEQKEKIGKLFSPLACDMEGSAVGQVAVLNKVPYVVLRSISDNADEGAETISRDFEGTVARHSAAVVVEMLKTVESL